MQKRTFYTHIREKRGARKEIDRAANQKHDSKKLVFAFAKTTKKNNMCTNIIINIYYAALNLLLVIWGSQLFNTQKYLPKYGWVSHSVFMLISRCHTVHMYQWAHDEYRNSYLQNRKSFTCGIHIFFLFFYKLCAILTFLTELTFILVEIYTNKYPKFVDLGFRKGTALIVSRIYAIALLLAPCKYNLRRFCFSIDEQ